MFKKACFIFMLSKQKWLKWLKLGWPYVLFFPANVLFFRAKKAYEVWFLNRDSAFALRVSICPMSPSCPQCPLFRGPNYGHPVCMPVMLFSEAFGKQPENGQNVQQRNKWHFYNCLLACVPGVRSSYTHWPSETECRWCFEIVVHMMSGQLCLNFKKT